MPTDSTSHLPRILCLHGGGTNSRIFRAQCRIIRRHLENSFRLVFSDAPYISKPGPDVTSVYADWGPFRSWMKPQPGATNYPLSTPSHHAVDVLMPVHEDDANEVINAIDESLTATMKADDEAGATGEWIGLLGFSQGAKLSASLLLREQYQMELAALSYQSAFRTSQGPRFRFAVLLAGRGPLVTLNPDFQAFFGREEDIQEAILRLPTVHVHGLQDEGLPFHRHLRDRCCVRESTTTVEWDGSHRVPIKAPDVVAVVKALMAVYQHSRAL
ncbi:citrinin biosynthesis oxidoreductase CtnB [Melanomma pulvis-pyrius CBS 109.77]|uniref:Citrinin biosynthesis oxidoreductase CtnB n=1 Tax=Melanomma pulvis-pyrius CBS 109.77 TaxID=1314802 RepID=A0A6A6XA51_9PLEO|nr:citrinin biosynthesis oxidoreductase CtnB [Melanomma pulvis-pyrius CBS 109.77]